MKNKIIVALGIILIIAQIVSCVGMSKMYVGLYPDNTDLLYPSYSHGDAKLSLGETAFAIQAGIDRFISGFGDLAFSKDTYRNITATQYASAYIRESLGCSGDRSFGLTVYDAVLTISYYFVGILGVTLVVLSTKSKAENHSNKTQKEEEA